MKANLTELRARAKYINEQKHPEFDLILWNYSNSCQFDGAWDEYTMMCRGLVTDLDGTVVARPFRKFFNLEQHADSKLSRLMELGTPAVFEKLDGSLGVQYFNSGVPYITTRGSFGSEQAKWATEWLRGFIQSHGDVRFADGYTYLYEILYPGNRIVVNYGARAELALLAVVNMDTGEELDYVAEATRLGLSYARPLEGTVETLLKRAKELPADEEGFVLKYPDGTRVKIKGDEYTRLHRLITGFSNKSIWELLKEGQSFDEFLEKVPDEFYNWVKKVKTELEQQFLVIEAQVRAEFEVASLVVQANPSRKAFADEFKKSKYSGLLFALLDNKSVEAGIWKMLRPKFAKPFKIDIDS